MINQQNDNNKGESRYLVQRMRKGTGVSSLLQAEGSETHYADSLQRFQKDFATYDRMKREEGKVKKQVELQRKRIEYLQRQNKRWQQVEQQYNNKMQRDQIKVQQQNMGIRRTANSNGLAYNPINLSYDKNPEGEKLKMKDEDTKIRGYVRAHNMDSRGNTNYNPINGGNRVGVQSIISQELSQRYEEKLKEHYENYKLHPPSTATSVRDAYRNYY